MLPAITPLKEADLPDVLALEKACFAAGSWTMEQMQSRLRQGHLVLFGAKDKGRLLGYVSIQVLPPEVEILNLAVVPSIRGRGLGRGLVQAALDHARALGAQTCFLEVAANNVPALRLYQGLGFAITGRRRDYYRDQTRNVDALTMKLELNQ